MSWRDSWRQRHGAQHLHRLRLGVGPRFASIVVASSCAFGCVPRSMTYGGRRTMERGDSGRDTSAMLEEPVLSEEL